MEVALIKCESHTIVYMCKITHACHCRFAGVCYIGQTRHIWRGHVRPWQSHHKAFKESKWKWKKSNIMVFHPTYSTCAYTITSVVCHSSTCILLFPLSLTLSPSLFVSPSFFLPSFLFSLSLSSSFSLSLPLSPPSPPSLSQDDIESPPSVPTDSQLNTSAGGSVSIEFPLTHYYELEGRVHTEQWSIPYKKEESLGVCMIAVVKMMKEG